MIDKITNNQIGYISAGMTAVGVGVGYANHKPYARKSKEILEKSLVELDEFKENYIKSHNAEVYSFCAENETYAAKVRRLLLAKGLKSIEDLRIKEILEPEDYKIYKNNIKAIKDKAQETKEGIIQDAKRHLKNDKIKNIAGFGLLGLALSSILPIAKYIEARKANENKPNNTVQ